MIVAGCAIVAVLSPAPGAVADGAGGHQTADERITQQRRCVEKAVQAATEGFAKSDGTYAMRTYTAGYLVGAWSRCDSAAGFAVPPRSVLEKFLPKR